MGPGSGELVGVACGCGQIIPRPLDCSSSLCNG